MHTNILRTASQKKSQGSESSLAKYNMIDFAPDIYFVNKSESVTPIRLANVWNLLVGLQTCFPR
jgi:hypothetical protein